MVDSDLRLVPIIGAFAVIMGVLFAFGRADALTIVSIVLSIICVGVILVALRLMFAESEDEVRTNIR